MRALGRRAPVARTTEGGGRIAVRLLAQAVKWIPVTAIAGGLLWLVWIYGNGLRDARYLDGWVLAIGMSIQLSLHIAKKTISLRPKSALRWRKVHILLGYILIAAFVSHSDFSLPDTGFEWAMWTGFVLVTTSGMIGTYLTWALRAKHGIDEHVSYQRIAGRQAELARELHATIVTNRCAAVIALPAPSFDTWIEDLYATRLRDFVQGKRSFATHLFGAQQSLRRLTEEIDSLSGYVDQSSKEKLAIVKSLVVEKDRLEFERIYLGLTRGWLFVHVPATYSLIVLTVVHIVTVYSFSSGVW